MAKVPYAELKTEAHAIVRDWLDGVAPPKIANLTLGDINDLVNAIIQHSDDVQARATAKGA